MAKTVNARLIIRNNTSANFTSTNPVLLKGEMGLESDTRKFKFGDGVSTWTALQYASANPAVVKTTAPAITDAGYDIGVVWVNSSTKKSYIISDNTAGAAIWKQILTTEDVSGAGDMLKSLFATIDPGNGYVDKAKSADEAAQAVKLKTARKINGVNFDGTTDITIADSTKEPAITGDVVTKFWSGLKTWRDLATDVRAVLLTGLSTATNSAIAATDSLLSALGKLQAQITANLTALTNHTGSTSNPHAVTKAQVGLGNVDNTADSAKVVAAAAKLTTPRTIAISGDGAGSAAFDGSDNVSLAMVLANVVAAGTGCKITVNAKGLVTGISALAASDIPAITLSKISDAGTAASKNVGAAVGNVVIVGADGKIDGSLMPSVALTDVFEAASQAAMLALSSAEKGDICVRSDINKTYILKQNGYATLANWVELKTPTDTVISVNGQTGAITLTTANIAEGTNLYWTEARGTANFNTNFALKTSTGLADSAHIIYDTDTVILDGGN